MAKEKEINLNNIPEKMKEFYKKPTTQEELWENIQKLKEVHDPEKNERVIIKLGDPCEGHKFVYMIDDKGNKYVVALPHERYEMHIDVRKLEEKLLKHWGGGEKIKEVIGGGWISTRDERLIIYGRSEGFGEAPKEEVAEILKRAFPEIKIGTYPHDSQLNVNDYLESREAILDIMKIYPQKLKDLPENFRDDKEIVLEAVKKSGWALEYASERLKDDKEVVLAAAKTGRGGPICYASERLKKDPDLDPSKFWESN